MTKKHKKSVGPSFALALVAIAAPVLAAGIGPSFAAESGTGSELPVLHQSGFMGNSLFNLKQFMIIRRNHDIPAAAADDQVELHRAAPVINPCDQTQQSSSSVSSSARPLTVNDLTSTQRDTLRHQLRNNACPDKAEAGYLELCRRLLREKPAQESLKGLVNPNQ